MLDLLGTAFLPASDTQDKITYLTSVKYLLSVQTETAVSVAEKIRVLLSETSSSLDGMRYLNIALQQNPDIYLHGRWSSVLLEVLKDSRPLLFKEQACKVFCTIFNILKKDTVANSDEIQSLATSLFTCLITVTKLDIEWLEPAILCLTAGVKSFPLSFEIHKDALRNLIIKQTCIASSKHFEALADCFTLLPMCSRNLDCETYQEYWLAQYLRTLNTMHALLNQLLGFLPDECKTVLSNEYGTYDLGNKEDGKKDLESKFLHVRQFINLNRCLAKMLSSKSTFAVQVPIQLTLEFIGRLFAVDEIAKLNASSPENQLVMATLCQMQIAVLVLLEPLIINFNLLPFSYYISDILLSALRASSLSNISEVTVSQIHHTVWKVLNVWLGTNGAKAAFKVILQPSIIMELLKDITIEEKKPQPSSSHTSKGKSKKKASLNAPKKNTYINHNLYYVCKEALTALEQIFYTGAPYLSRKMFEEIFTAVVRTARLLHPSEDAPFPYDNVKCRVNLYSVLLAITLVCKPEQRSCILSAIGIFNNALRDPNAKVKSFSHKAAATCRVFLHPKRPPPIIKESDTKQKKRSDILSTMPKFVEWSVEDTYQNIPPVESNASENLPSHTAQTFHNPNDSEMHSNDYIQVEPCYSEQAEENQLNGEDILEIQNSSHCQEEESDEDEEEEEEDDRSYIEEEMDIPEEHIYIPSTSELQMINPVHIIPETRQSEEQEYEELKPASKAPTSVPDDNNSKNMHLNGVRSIVPDEEMPSASTENVANENGINGSEEEEMEEEEADEDEEEEEHTYPTEKKIPEFFEAPAKKPKLEIDVEEKVEDADMTDGRTESPTMLEMKADFCFSEVQNVTS